LLGVTAESLRAKRDQKLAISLQRFHFDPKVQVEGFAPPPIIFARLVTPMNDLQLCRWHFSNKETLSLTFFKRNAIFLQKPVVLRFWDPFWGT